MRQPNSPENTGQTFSRREALKAALVVPAASMLAAEPAHAGGELDIPLEALGGYDAYISYFRAAFGQREDYQLGFKAATRDSNNIVELPAGLYGIHTHKNTSQAIGAGTVNPVERAGYLHAVQKVEQDHNDIVARWLIARKKLIGSTSNRIRRTIAEKYPKYKEARGLFGGLWLLDEVSSPVVTFKNYSQHQLEAFVRIPHPDTREFHKMALKDWGDTYDQSKLRHKHPWGMLYDPGMGLFENLKVIYGPELESYKQSKQGAKNRLAQWISAANKLRVASGKSGLTRQQKATLNDWLDVKGTQYEIK